MIFYAFSQKKSGLRVLMYHSINRKVEDDIYDIYNMPNDLFEKHIKIIKDYNLVSLKEENLLKIPTGLSITFDDGFANNYYIAEKLCSLFEIPFSVFVTANNVKQKKEGFLNKKELIDLSNCKNVNIGSHSFNHINLAEHDEKKIRNELYNSKAYLEDLLGKEINTISYPNGSVNRVVRDCAADIGYKIGFTSINQINDDHSDLLLLSRTPIYSLDNENILKQKIRGQWDWMRHRRKIFKKIKFY